MAQVIDSVPSSVPELCCCYTNASSKIQVVRITNIANWYFERVVFPGQRLMFEAPFEALLEVHCGMMASSILSDTIPCQRLSLHDTEAGLVSPFHVPVQSGESEGPAVEAAEVHDLLTVSPSVAS